MSVENYIQLAGIVVTAIFSWLVFRATKATAEVAKSTYKLNERLAADEEKRAREQLEIMRMQLKNVILSKFEKIENTLAQKEPMEILRALPEAPKELEVSSEDLAKYFTVEEASTITAAWKTYQDYLSEHYRRSHYSGNEINILTENAEKVLEEFNKVINLLKH